jgi:alcohol dehydrogenase class IV
LKQTVYTDKRIDTILPEILESRAVRKLFVVCGQSCRRLKVAEDVAALPAEKIWFQDFRSNPDYDSVVNGIQEYKKASCDAILAIGGGSAMDVAKCIKLFSGMEETENYLRQTPVGNNIPLIAVPTTAGTGSEATRFAVIYFQGEKQSVTHDSILPEYVFLMPEVLEELPLYQKKATSLDALCHAVESFWSVNSTEESRALSGEAIRLIDKYLAPYLKGNQTAATEMFQAAYIAGEAINITQTTAGHAMCYKLTSLYKISHGHAAALCVEKLWPYMLRHIEDCTDGRGKEYLEKSFAELADVFGCADAKAAADKFCEIMRKLELPELTEEGNIEIQRLVKSVNLTRLKNNPVKLDEKALTELYEEILKR